ncbi:hypothetical protein [Achromobacter pestifer]|uniref:Receptor protein-tyrosine kinase n=1 Tax=Achromobacter pestifer TaxID=1353889 RepID=A0A6S6Z144_9BURK|nr:hypothetical protein LMG3431_02661 [Achromobacter pestifer]
MHRELARWPQLHLYIDRIFDGLVNGDLPYGRRGITSDKPQLLSDPELTVRHVDLRMWMQQHYPNHRPDFLFDPLERTLHPAISIETIQMLLVEREILRATCATCQRDIAEAKVAYESLQREHERLLAQRPPDDLSQRAETTYLNVIGALLHLMLAESPAGTPYSTLRSQEAVVSALVAHHTGLMGITERTLHAKFAEANRRLAAQVA